MLGAEWGIMAGSEMKFRVVKYAAGGGWVTWLAE
jgi:hypothetical protein